MEVDFNNLRKQLAFSFDKVTKKLNEGILPEKAYNGNKYGNILVDTEDLQKSMEELRSCIISLLCCYEEGNPDCINVYDDVQNNGGLAKFNDTENDENWAEGVKKTSPIKPRYNSEKFPPIDKFAPVYITEYSDGVTRECIEIKREQLPNVPTGKRMSLVYLNNDTYTGFFVDLDDNNIILRSINNKHMIGLPYDNLYKIVVERY